jgi:uncharacterized protein YukE
MKITGIRRQRQRSVTPSGSRGAVARPKARERTVSPRVRAQITRLVVDVGNRASAWRGAADDAELAYRRWKSAALEERGDAAAAYLAAIEREEKAAAEYSRALDACCSTVP